MQLKFQLFLLIKLFFLKEKFERKIWLHLKENNYETIIFTQKTN